MLTTATIEHILATIPNRTIGVLGDLFLDRYLDIDPALTEPSIETGLDAYQVVRVRAMPGAAGTVINNLVALGAGRVVPISMVGDDGEGYELRQALERAPSVCMNNIVSTRDCRTPTYAKPMFGQRELNRLDIKNRAPLPATVENTILRMLAQSWASSDVLLVLDQVSEPDCGVVTACVRARLEELAESDAKKIVIADSRERIGFFRNVWLKPNERECLRATRCHDLNEALKMLVNKTDRPVICTRSERGMLVVELNGGAIEVPAYPVAGPIDSVGAGDSSSAAMACALACGTTLVEAAAFGNLIASITIQQIGTTGTATPAQIRQRWQDVFSPAS